MKIIAARIFLLLLLLWMNPLLFAQGGSVQNHLSDSLQSYVAQSHGSWAFTHAHIIDGSGKVLLEDGTLLIEGSRIRKVGTSDEVAIPEGFEVISCQGKTIIPGLVGMHNHLHIPGRPDVASQAAKLYLASGVTTIQTCGAADAQRELELSEQIRSGWSLGPEIIPSAPYVTGPGGNPNMIIPRNDQHLKDTLTYWLSQGVKWFKVYRNVRTEDLRITLERVHASGGKVRGHLCSVSFREAALMGIDGIEHGLNSTADFRSNHVSGLCGGGREYMDELSMDEPRVKDLLSTMVEHKVVLTSTLAVYESSVPNRVYAEERELNVMSDRLREDFNTRLETAKLQWTDSTRNKRLERIMAFEYEFVQAGGLLCSGVDAGRHVLPGFGDQRNYLLHLESGFTPLEAVQIMSANGARAMERDDIGILREGARADFVILDGHLIDDPSTIKRVHRVFQSGIGYNPALILESVQGKFGI
ncbi:MAG: amidohydrolase [Bacteroidetes bacterium]|nr:MAG: amidohydrolase [Bacteroidota bacterium]